MDPWQYRYSDVVTTLAAAKGSVVHYRRASQSGVQSLSMQLGVMPIVSTAGAPARIPAAGLPPIGIDDAAGLAAAFDLLADPSVAAQYGGRGNAPLRTVDSPSTLSRNACWKSSQP